MPLRETHTHARRADKIERVAAMLRSPILNRLAREYSGEDFSALQAKFMAEVQKIKDVDDKYQKRFRDNIKRYEENVSGADAIVNKKLKVAREKYDSVTKSMDKNRLSKLKSQLKSIEREAEKIAAKKSKSSWDVRHLGDLQNQMVVLQNQISQFEDVAGLTSADVAHMEATEAETEARRKFDLAGKTLTIDNDTALLERDYEQDVYNLASRYETASLDAVRQSIQRAKLVHAQALDRAEKKLSFIKGSALNLDFMNAEEIEAMRRKVARRISEDIIERETQK